MTDAGASLSCEQLRERLQFFHFLTGDDLCVLLRYCDCRQVPARGTLWQEGEPGEFTAFIFEGEVEERKATGFGKQVVVGLYGPGTVVGEAGIVDGQPRATTAVAAGEVLLVTLDRDQLRKLLADDPVLGVKLLQGLVIALSARLRQCFSRLTGIF